MKINFKSIVAALLLLVALPLAAQDQACELNCDVDVNAEQVQSANKNVFQTLKEAISDYMNTTKWTDAQFSTNEKIQCRLFFTITEWDDGTGKMSGNLQIQSMRPVYNSSYTTTLINFKDNKIEFTYQENEPLVFAEQEMVSNLTAILNFYAYLIIAVDFDSFGSHAGDPYFEKAATVVRLAQSSGESGWKAFEDTKNRSAVLSAFTDKVTSPLRDILYDYHRQGLDQMVVSVDKGRASITKCVETIATVHEAAPMSVGISMFKDAKLDELVNVYSKAGTAEKEKVYDILYDLYPTEQTRLAKIKETSN